MLAFQIYKGYPLRACTNLLSLTKQVNYIHRRYSLKQSYGCYLLSLSYRRFFYKESVVEPLKAVQKRTKNPIPVIGMESKPESKDKDKYSEIALRAYYKAEARGYEPGHEIQDWLDAEAEIGAEAGK